MQGAAGRPGKPGKQGREGMPGADVSFSYHVVWACKSYLELACILVETTILSTTLFCFASISEKPNACCLSFCTFYQERFVVFFCSHIY